MKKRLLSLCLALALCLGLTIPAAAAAEDQKIVVGEETYQQVLAALMAQEDNSVTLRLDTDIQLTGAAVVLGASDYGGLLGGQVVTVAPHDITIDLNGHTLTGEKNCAIFEVQSGYTQTILDSSEAKTGRLVSQGKVDVEVKEGGICHALSAAPVNPFSDVSESSPFYQGILWAVDNGVTNGATATTFAPSSPCTRAHIITFLWRAAGQPEPQAKEPCYEDVTDASAYYYKAVQWASEMGMAEDDVFNAGGPCTRAAAVYFIWRANGSEAADTAAFTDVKADADYAAAVNWAVAQGVTNGTTAATFSPDATCTRGQIATFLYRAAMAEQG